MFIDSWNCKSGIDVNNWGTIKEKRNRWRGYLGNPGWTL